MRATADHLTRMHKSPLGMTRGRTAMVKADQRTELARDDLYTLVLASNFGIVDVQQSNQYTRDR